MNTYSAPRAQVVATAQTGSPTAALIQQKAEEQVKIAAAAAAFAASAQKSGDADLAAKFSAQAQQNISNANQLMTTIVAPTETRDVTKITYDAQTVQARGVVDAYTASFNDTVATLVKPQLFPDGAQQFKADIQTWAMIQYPSALLPCSAENTARVGIRADIYARAQQALAQLLVVKPAYSGLSMPMGSVEREYASRLTADWFTIVYSWVSLAYFATNVQPQFLLPANPTTTMTDADGKPGVLLPDRALPPLMQSVLNELRGAPQPVDYGDKEVAKDPWLKHIDRTVTKLFVGPLWMGFYDADGPTGWLTGDFAPQYDSRTANDMLGNESDRVRPQNLMPTDRTTTQIKNDLRSGAWHFWYQQCLHSNPEDTTFVWRRWEARVVREDDYEWYTYTSIYGAARMAEGWIRSILETSLADHTINATLWYISNHVTYWAERGLIDLSIDEAKEYQVGAAQAQVDAKAQAAQQTILQVGGAVTAVASSNPIALGVTLAATTLATGITSLVAMRRKKKAGNKADVMQPLVLRTLSDVPCATFDRGGSLPAALITALSHITGELAMGGQQAVTTVTVQPNLAPAADGSVVANPVITAVALNQNALASSPSSLPIITSSGDAATTSTSSSMPTASGSTPTPMPTPLDLQNAIAQAATMPSVVPGSSSIPWMFIGGGLLLAGGLALFAKRTR